MVSIDFESPIPLEEQLRQEIRGAIARSEVSPGDALPSARQLGSDLGIHWNTVARTYRRLRDDGLLVVRRGRGVSVREVPSHPSDALPENLDLTVTKSINEAITEARLAGLSLESFRARVLNELQHWEKTTHEQPS